MSRRRRRGRRGQRRERADKAALLAHAHYLRPVDVFWTEQTLLLLALVVGLPVELYGELARRLDRPGASPIHLTDALLAPEAAPVHGWLYPALRAYWNDVFAPAETGLEALPGPWFVERFHELADKVHREGFPLRAPLSVVGQIYASGRADRRPLLLSLRREIVELLLRDYPFLATLGGPGGELFKPDVHRLVKLLERAGSAIDRSDEARRRAEQRASTLASELEEARAESAALRRRLIQVEQARDLEVERLVSRRFADLSRHVEELQRRVEGLDERLRQARIQHRARVADLEQEIAALESLVFESEEVEAPPAAPLIAPGQRLLIVGKVSEETLRPPLEALGLRVLFEPDDGKAAVNRLPVDLVVVATSRVSHATYDLVKTGCRRLKVPFRHWGGTGWSSLARLLGRPRPTGRSPGPEPG